MQAIQAGTRISTGVLGWEDRVGTIELGKLAHMVAVAGDPPADASELEPVIFVVKGGTVVTTP